MGRIDTSHEFAELICERFNIHFYKGLLFWQDGHAFSPDMVGLRTQVFHTMKKMSKAEWEDTAFLLPSYATKVTGDDGFNIRLKNGIIKNGIYYPEDNNNFTIFNLPLNYNPEAYDEHVDNFLNFVSCDDKELRTVLEEIVGHILMTKDFPQNFFFLTGEGSNGKSTFIEMLRGFVTDLTSTIDFDDFNSTVHAHKLIGKLLNIGDDADDVHLEKAKNLKSMASGNSITVKTLYEAPITMTNTATLVFTANNPPSFRDKSYGLIRRLKVIPFEATIVKKELGFTDRLKTESAKEYLLSLGLCAIKRILDNSLEISYSKRIEERTKRYHLEHDSVASWEQENPINIDTEVRKSYREYSEWCKEGGLNPVHINNFGRRMHKLGYETDEQWSSDAKKNVSFYIPKVKETK